MTLRYITIALVSLFIIAGCKDNSSDIDAGAEGLALRAVNTGTDDLEIEMDRDAGTTFCYEEETCGEFSGFSFFTIYPDNSSLIATSKVDKEAVGIKVAFHVTKGQGVIEVVDGEAYRDDAGFREFNEGDVLHTSTSFSEGDVVEFSFGETN